MANLNFNKIILGGRLTSAPELKQTQSGVPVCSFSVAVNRRAKAGEERVADFFNVTAWRARHQDRFVQLQPRFSRRCGAQTAEGDPHSRGNRKDPHRVGNCGGGIRRTYG